MSAVAFIDPNRHEKILRDALKKFFGYNSFRPHQLEICLNILQNKDTFVVMSTGSGKSLTFQLPAIALHDLGYRVCTIVISPLISLIEDQVLGLRALGIAAGAIGGNVSNEDELRASNGEFVVLYATPEKIDHWKEGLKALAKTCKIICVAIDESHCVSEWGHDFRPVYRKISEIRSTLSSATPTVALTATATTSVQADIISNLKLYQPMVIKTTFNRPNLKYFVSNRSGKLDLLILLQALRKEQLADIARISGIDGEAHDVLFTPTLVYVNTKKDAEALCESVNTSSLKVFKSIKVAYYHAGMTPEERTAVHKDFLADRTQVVVATLAFGLGIHKPDIRIVIHFGMTKSVESYYQQTGRAGRDGHPARCYLLYSRQDLAKCFNIATSSSMSAAQTADNSNGNAFNFIAHTATQLHQMNEYAVGTCGCRRKFLLEYFGEALRRPRSPGGAETAAHSENCCDLCDYALANNLNDNTGGGSATDPSSRSYTCGTAAIDLAVEARLLLSAIIETGECHGLGTPISILVGSHEKTLQRIHNFTQLPAFNAGNFHSREWWRAFGFQLSCDELGLVEGVLTNGSNFGYERFVVTIKGRLFLQTAGNNLFVVPSTDLARLHAHERRQTNSGNAVAADNALTRASVNIDSIFVTDGPGGTSGSPDDAGSSGALRPELRSKLEMVLRKVRADVSSRLGMVPGSILSINQISSLVECRPMTVQHLEHIESWGAWRRANLGGYFVGAIAKFVEDFQIDPVSPFVARCDAADAARASGAEAAGRAAESDTSGQAALLRLPTVPLYKPNYASEAHRNGDDGNHNNNDDSTNEDNNLKDDDFCANYEGEQGGGDENHSSDSNGATSLGDELSIVPSFSLAAQHRATSAAQQGGFDRLSYGFVAFDLDAKRAVGRSGESAAAGGGGRAPSTNFKTIQKRKLQNMITMPCKK